MNEIDGPQMGERVEAIALTSSKTPVARTQN